MVISHCICKGNPPNPLYIKGIPYINAMGNAPSPLFRGVLGTFCTVTLRPRGVIKKTGYLGSSRVRGERVSGVVGRVGHLFPRAILARIKKLWFLAKSDPPHDFLPDRLRKWAKHFFRLKILESCMLWSYLAGLIARGRARDRRTILRSKKITWRGVEFSSTAAVYYICRWQIPGHPGYRAKC